MQVLVTFFPLLDVTKDIAGPEVIVDSLIPPGVESHEYEPGPSDMRQFMSADLFVRIGLEWAPLEDRVIAATGKDIPTIMVSDGIELVKVDSAIDPHVWLSPEQMMIVANNIAAGLKKNDPANGQRYDDNLKTTLAKLKALDDEYESGLSGCGKDTIIVSHLAFGYTGKDYGFSEIGISGLAPETEPSPGALRNLIDNVREHKLKYVLYEELVDPKVSDAIAREVGAKTLVISHVDVKESGDYYSIMRKNLQTLRTALECK
jgi:zinc transport system substrate-binding protein